MTPEEYAQRKAAIWQRYADILPERSYMVDLHPGWLDLIEEVLAAIRQTNEERGEKGRVVQIKEKFGELRIYAHDTSTTAHRNIRERSLATCQHCGAPGEVGPDANGWYSTCCPKCRILRNAIVRAPSSLREDPRIERAYLTQVDLSDLSLPEEADLEQVLTAIERAQVQKAMLAVARSEIDSQRDTLEKLSKM